MQKEIQVDDDIIKMFGDPYLTDANIYKKIKEKIK